MGGRGSSYGLVSSGSTIPAPSAVAAETSERSSEGEYHLFEGDPIMGGWEYGGSHKAVKDFFDRTTNYDELISKMSREEREAFRNWARGYFMSGQQYKGWEDMSTEDRRLTRIYDKYLNQTEVREGFTVYRAAGYELINSGSRSSLSIDEIRGMVGEIIPSKGSMSTGCGTAGLVGMGRGSGKSVEYKINIPKGSTGAGMWIGDDRINGWGPKQREFMTNRDSLFRIDGVRINEKGRTEVELTYVGHTKHHDYGEEGRKRRERRAAARR